MSYDDHFVLKVPNPKLQIRPCNYVQLSFQTDIHFKHFKCCPVHIVGWFVSVLIEWICKYLCHRDPTELSVYKFDNLLIGEHTIQLYARHHTRAPRENWLTH